MQILFKARLLDIDGNFFKDIHIESADSIIVYECKEYYFHREEKRVFIYVEYGTLGF